jgi:hypothetical protein
MAAARPEQQLIAIAVTFMLCVMSSVDGYYLPADSTGNDLSRDKRYTDYQERASAFCTGVCMFEERKPYTDCFDLCNWTGTGPSPWIKLDKEKGRITANGPADAENNAGSVASLMRTGTKPKFAKVKGRTGTKKAGSWEY